MQNMTNILIEEAVSFIIDNHNSSYYSSCYDFNTCNDYKIEEVLAECSSYDSYGE